PLDWPPDLPPGISWADATANPANNAAVLTNSFFLMEWSSSSRFSPPCRPMRIGSGDNDVDGAQFRPRTQFHCGRSDRFWGTKFLQEVLGNPARWVQCKIASESPS